MAFIGQKPFMKYVTYLINRLLTEIQAIVARKREETPHQQLSYEKLFQQSCDEVSAQRARVTGMIAHLRSRPRAQAVAVHYMD